MDLNVEKARSFFPQLEDGLIYFENAGGSYIARPVVERLTTYLTDSRVQPEWGFASAKRAKPRRDAGLLAAAALMGCGAADVLVGHSTTNHVYVCSHALAGYLKGHAIVVTDQDHEANSGAWRRLADRGVGVRVWPVSKTTGGLELDALRPLLDDQVRLVCMPHVSNVIGEINPVREVADLAHAVGAKLFVDGVAYAPHRRVDVKALGADFYVFSAYKVYGPHVGLLYVAPEMRPHLENQNHCFLGGIGLKSVNPGGQQYEQLAALAGVTDYFDALRGEDSLEALFEAFAAHETTLLAAMLEGLQTRGCTIVGPSAPDRGTRVPTIAFTPNASMGTPNEVAQGLAERGIATGAAHFYAPRVLESLGLDLELGVCRASLVHTSTLDEVARFFSALDEL